MKLSDRVVVAKLAYLWNTYRRFLTAEPKKAVLDFLRRKDDSVCIEPRSLFSVFRAKRRFLERELGKTQVELMKAIKKVFDPYGILNPGKIWA